MNELIPLFAGLVILSLIALVAFWALKGNESW